MKSGEPQRRDPCREHCMFGCDSQRQHSKSPGARVQRTVHPQLLGTPTFWSLACSHHLSVADMVFYKKYLVIVLVFCSS